MQYIEHSEELVGYTVKLLYKAAFKVLGYTVVVPARRNTLIQDLYRDIASDGRREKLLHCSSVHPWLLGLGSWDPECEKHGSRYTICIEDTERTDFTQLTQEYTLFSKEIGESNWLCFETTLSTFLARFWKDNPYKMLKKLGYEFNMRDDSVGVHIDAFPPAYDEQTSPNMEFWITVK